MIKEINGTKPRLEKNCFIAETASVTGNVSLGQDSSVWYGVVLRGDVEPIQIGDTVNIQDNAVVHSSHGFPVTIGNGVTVGHNAVLHSCRIGNNCLIGIGATILDGACIGNNCIIGANSLVNNGLVVPDGMMAYGSPAKIIRRLTGEEIQHIRAIASDYITLAKLHSAPKE
ncbi:MAG: gamma carbonic anhydrase family protein [Christensenellales bacterium]